MTPDLPASPGEPNLAQIERVVEKVEDVMATYLEGGEKLGLSLDTGQVLEVIDRALEEAEGRGNTDFGSDVSGFHMSGLYEELIQQPSNIFEQITLEDGEKTFVPLSPALWKACLGRLRARVEALD
ncbi:MAG: hypothetical protein SFU85_04010 [Candidatus Methylacidiphilales bacterium]|nr:hypothetical protein [Candidatus Methylacidiphilales bacterium]